MFEPTKSPRIFACAPGVDFPKALVDGLFHRLKDQPPEAMAQVEVFVNTRRMQRRIHDLFDQGPDCLLPGVRLVTDIGSGIISPQLPAAVSPLRRRLELSQLVAKLLDKEPDLAPRASLFDLADSLALLLAEMQDEAVSPEDIFRLDISDSSGHWQRSQHFLQIVSRYFGPDSTEPPDLETRQRRVIEHLIAKWALELPRHPVIVAGSTGSRGTTGLLMQAVARLPQGAVILPGFDFELPAAVWENLDDGLAAEDHAQFRMRRVMISAGIDVSQVAPWLADQTPPVPSRNRLVSLALRPAPVTAQWLSEGPVLRHVDAATRDMTLIEAASERAEAMAIALALRQAADLGKTAALVTPDQLLTRRVRAALDRWRIEPDVSVGEPLDKAAPGRLLRHVADLIGKPVTGEALLILLKHPLANTGGDERGRHLGWTRELELKLRRKGPPFPVPQTLTDLADKEPENKDHALWADWIGKLLLGFGAIGHQSLREHLHLHITTSSALAAGPGQHGAGQLWDAAAGIEAKRVVDELTAEAEHGGILSPLEYSKMFHAVLKRGEVRDPVRPHPNIMIWGTLEARVQGADLVILGGLNDGIWPEHTAPDPWLNRDMRHRVGLLVPERKIGLSAHDFQQAIAAKEVILTRAKRNDEAETVPSRWLNRLTNLMGGMSQQGRDALDKMQRRGQAWLDMAALLETPAPVPAALRPSPIPPLAARPDALSVTAIARLIRDPYAIYARHILRLKRLDPLRQSPDAPLRGTIVHRILEQFIGEFDPAHDAAAQKSRLMSIAGRIFEQDAQWPVARLLWSAKLERAADAFLDGEAQRQGVGQPTGLELVGSHRFAEVGFTLTAKADRIDRTPDDRLWIYDYKTGAPPSKDQLRYFDKQLLLEAVLAEAGAFETLGASAVAGVAHIGLGATPRFVPVRMEPGETTKLREEFVALIASYQRSDQGYTSRRAMVKMRFDGDYDHLARFGEWDETQPPEPIEVGE